MKESNRDNKEFLIGIGRAGISVVPGGAVINELLSTRDRIYQNRINYFVETFLKLAEKNGVRVELEQLSSEQFIDIMVSVFNRVVETNSEKKIEIFRNILLHNISMKHQSNFKETFLDLASRLDYIEVEILKLFRGTGRTGNLECTDADHIGSEELASASYRKEIIDIIKSYFPESSEIDARNKYEFYMSDLTSKSLLMDKRTVGTTWTDIGAEAFELMYLTVFGKEFLEFIGQ